MSSFTPFLSCVYPLALLQHRVKIIQSLVHYATFNWRDQFSGSMNPMAADFFQSVQSAMAPHFFNLVEVSPRRRKGFTQPLDTVEHVISAFEGAMRFNDHELIAVPHFNDQPLTIAFEQRFSGPPFQAMLINNNQEADPTVAGALRMAQSNFSQNQSRRLTVSVIYSLLKQNDFSQQEQLAREADLTHHLHTQKELAVRDMLLFSGLLGGEAQARTLELVARHTCHKEDTDGVHYSVMHFINSDRRHPGMHKAKTAEALKADIKTKYEAL